VTLRDNTERPVTVAQGTNRLAGTRADGIRLALAEALHAPVTVRVPPHWDGHAAERVAGVMARALGVGAGRVTRAAPRARPLEGPMRTAAAVAAAAAE
jgi:UDP-N-acetylglucosamine 2-epimerase (non-hydrolysing)